MPVNTTDISYLKFMDKLFSRESTSWQFPVANEDVSDLMFYYLITPTLQWSDAVRLADGSAPIRSKTNYGIPLLHDIVAHQTVQRLSPSNWHIQSEQHSQIEHHWFTRAIDLLFSIPRLFMFIVDTAEFRVGFRGDACAQYPFDCSNITLIQVAAWAQDNGIQVGATITLAIENYALRRRNYYNSHELHDHSEFAGFPTSLADGITKLTKKAVAAHVTFSYRQYTCATPHAMEPTTIELLVDKHQLRMQQDQDAKLIHKTDLVFIQHEMADRATAIPLRIETPLPPRWTAPNHLLVPSTRSGTLRWIVVNVHQVPQVVRPCNEHMQKREWRDPDQKVG